ncbi:ABC transporter, permease protein [Marvinbryantia formatexigens DSM 14469]|uniref:ABC transporter, permease protein n=1 Tax=Marvinbryantia formatexigens DSM 14469 TaxID=478749 RepID=C6L908_9FIRM|nr:carbohydrate ABC transporter permease [Marvinbryantia formatexigens]EET62747.1 ABC transporter, permease protein [Marvinbryantia formatexigens DSM 14469]UWO23112.1 carbohydrate ABC transporter permease [Marvinbryantia formatexigens DSM 14469]SDF99857.1 putative aldouronate transport system permease protein [Marvinbryantia formatexigens]
MNKKGKIQRADILVTMMTVLIIIITLYPVIYVISMSFSDPNHVLAKDVYLFPKGFSLKAYKMILNNKTVLRSFGNTVWYTIVGTLISVTMTVSTAYPLSRKRFFLRKQLSFLMTLTMFVSGGLIPLYILVQKLHLYNTRWSVILPYIISAYNLIITRSFFESLPEEIADAAKIDGGTEWTIMTKVFIPLSKPIISVLTLFYGVGYWNSYFAPLIFLSNDKLQPIQLYLRGILLTSEMQSAGMGMDAVLMNEQMKYAVIVVACFPIMLLYPFIQKYFEKGVLIGAVK